jgi:hypothetical protein
MRTGPIVGKRPAAGRILTVALAAVLPLGASCSMLFVKQLPPVGQRTRYNRCTTSQVAPGFDVAFAGLQGVRTAYALTAPDSAYPPNAALPREADVIIGLALMTVHVASAAIGFMATAECRRVLADPAWGQQGAVRRSIRSSRQVEEEAQDWLLEQEAARRAHAQQAEAAKAAGAAAAALPATQRPAGAAAATPPATQGLAEPAVVAAPAPPRPPATAAPAPRPPSVKPPTSGP